MPFDPEQEGWRLNEAIMRLSDPEALAALPTVLVNCFDDSHALSSLVDSMLDEGSVTRAAERLWAAQSTVSAGIASLERSFGVRLFVARCNNSCAEQAVSNAVARATPRYPVIDDVCVHGSVLPYLTDLYPSVSFEDGESCLDCCDAFHAEKAGKGLV